MAARFAHPELDRDARRRPEIGRILRAQRSVCGAQKVMIARHQGGANYGATAPETGRSGGLIHPALGSRAAMGGH